jgi:hypothetical protein
MVYVLGIRGLVVEAETMRPDFSCVVICFANFLAAHVAVFLIEV